MQSISKFKTASNFVFKKTEDGKSTLPFKAGAVKNRPVCINFVNFYRLYELILING